MAAVKPPGDIPSQNQKSKRWEEPQGQISDLIPLNPQLLICEKGVRTPPLSYPPERRGEGKRASHELVRHRAGIEGGFEAAEAPRP